MNYKLSESEGKKNTTFLTVLTEVNKFIGGYGKKVILLALLAMVLILINSVINIVAPDLIGTASQNAITNRDKDALLQAVVGLIVLYAGASVANYFQILIMGWIGQNILSRLREKIFDKIQHLPIAFFNENKSGDLISRINNDTDKLNQALSETLLRFVGNIFVIVGIAIAMILKNPILGSFALVIALVLLVLTSLSSGILRTINKNALTATGGLSGEVQESLTNFKVIVAFNRRDYFKNAFNNVNQNSKKNNMISGIANNILTPLYDFGGNLALFVVYFIGINLITAGVFSFLGVDFKSSLEFGTLISYVLYVDRFYSPLRIMASLFASIQTSLAAWSRISELLSLQSNLGVVEDLTKDKGNEFVEFKDVSFGYNPEKMILKHVNISIDKGKTYALVGPTGGGKSTTASLMARLYDPSEGEILLNGLSLKSYKKDELTQKIGFILQEPFLFTGTIKDNVIYGNKKYEGFDEAALEEVLNQKGLQRLLERFPQGLSTEVSNFTDSVSLGQKQLIAFLRVILREPELLILDEATANIDTVTESLLQEIIDKLPASTTKIIIAHRLNTIQKADSIFFIANGEVSKPVKYAQALELINDTKKQS